MTALICKGRLAVATRAGSAGVAGAYRSHGLGMLDPEQSSCGKRMPVATSRRCNGVENSNWLTARRRGGLGLDFGACR